MSDDVNNANAGSGSGAGAASDAKAAKAADDARAIRKYREDGATPADIRRMVGLPSP